MAKTNKGASKKSSKAANKKTTGPKRPARKRAFYESIVDTIREPLVVLDRDLRVVLANRAYSAAFVSSAKEAEGHSIFEVEGRRWDIPEFKKLLEQVLVTNATVDDYEVKGDIRGLGPRKLLLNARRVRLDDKEPEYVLLAILDVTEREESIAQLEERTARLGAILSATPDAVINVDQQGNVASFSPGAERIFDYSAGEMIGKNIEEILVPLPGRTPPGDILAVYRRNGQKGIAGRGGEVTGRRKDGSQVPLMLHVTETNIGAFHGFTCVLRDLTEQKHTEAELRQARKMEVMGQLVGGVAHDFNNLLTVISGNLELLGRHIDAKHDRKLISAAQDAAKLAANLTNQMLVFARRRELTPARVEVNALIPDIVEMLRRMIDESIHLSTDLGKDVHAVFADEPSLRAALLNLAVNARDAMPEGGDLAIRTENVSVKSEPGAEPSGLAPGSYVGITVTDTGAGMPLDVQERALEPFFTTKDVGEGSGLGLSMVYGFVKQSGGDIKIESQPGKGTAVTMLLPAAAAAAATPSRGAKTEGVAPGGGERILVVEDDARVREATVLRLKTLGYAVVEAENGPAALQIVDKGEPFDLLFTDAIMPQGMCGRDLVEEVRKRRSDLRVLFTSGYPRADLPLEPDDVLLEKPYTIDEMARKLRAVLDR